MHETHPVNFWKADDDSGTNIGMSHVWLKIIGIGKN